MTDSLYDPAARARLLRERIIAIMTRAERQEYENSRLQPSEVPLAGSCSERHNGIKPAAP